MSEMTVKLQDETDLPINTKFTGFEPICEIPDNHLISRPWKVSGIMTTEDGAPTRLLPGDLIHYDTEKRWISVIRQGHALVIISLIDGEHRRFLEYLNHSSVVISKVFVATIAIISAMMGLSIERMDKPGFPGIAYRVLKNT